MRLKMTALVVGLAALTGCNAFDGTWLFQIDPNASFGGTCAEGIDPSAQAETLGTTHQIVDIYRAEDGQVVVLFDSDIHMGAVDGSSFAAEYTFDESGDGWSYNYTSEINATEEKGILSGTLREAERAVDDDGEETCSVEFDFTAERITSDEDKYLGD